MNTIDGSFRESALKFPDRTALRYYQDETWVHITYDELLNAVLTTAHGLAAMGFPSGLTRGSKVAIMSENRPEWFVCYLATVIVGAVAIPIDAALGETETMHILRHSGAETILCSLPCYEIISRILTPRFNRGVDSLHNIILFDRNITVRNEHKGEGKGKDVADKSRKKSPGLPPDLIGGKNFLSYDELRDKGTDYPPVQPGGRGGTTFPENKITDIASIIYTSGTTGMAKGVMLTHKNIISNVQSIRQIIHFDEEDNLLLLLPLHHSFPFTVCMVLPLSVGGSSSFVDILSRERARLIEECKPTIVVGVPLLYSKMYHGIIRQVQVSKLKNFIFTHGGKKIIGKALKKKLGGRVRIMVSGAAPMDPEVIEGFVDLGIEFLEGYGLTETSPVVSVNLPGAIKIGSIGPALPGVEVKIVNPDKDGIGEIAIRGDNVMLGYYNNREQTDLVLKEGWFFSGDLGTIDSDGYVYITGRAKDVIVTRGGKNVYPEVVEYEINKGRYIAESIVMGYKTKGFVGEDVGVVIVPDYESLLEYAKNKEITFTNEIKLDALTGDAKEEIVEKFSSLLESEVRKSMEKLASYQRVTRIGIERDEFVKTSTRKIKRFLYNGRLDVVDIEKD